MTRCERLAAAEDAAAGDPSKDIDFARLFVAAGLVVLVCPECKRLSWDKRWGGITHAPCEMGHEHDFRECPRCHEMIDDDLDLKEWTQ